MQEPIDEIAAPCHLATNVAPLRSQWPSQSAQTMFMAACSLVVRSTRRHASEALEER
jgi:hypothetical protein